MTNAWVLAELPAVVLAIVVALGVPLVLAVTGAPRVLRLAAWSTGALAAVGLVAIREAGTLAAIVTLPYVATCAAAAAVGAPRLLAALVARRASSLALAVALIFLPAAATWLLAARAGYALLGYPPFWVILTAAHFHVAGAFLIAIAGRVACDRPTPIAAAIALGCVAAVPLTAIGIYGPRWLEIGAGLLMAGSALGVGILLVTTRGLGQRMKRAAGAILLVTMPLAAAYALRDQVGAIALGGLDPLGSMLVAHGGPNALVFALIGLAAFAREKSPAEN